MQRRRLFQSTVAAMAFIAMLAAGCSSSGDDGGQAGAASESGSEGGGAGDVYKLTQQFDLSIEVSSTKFNETRRIPRTYSCERDDISAPIDWSGRSRGRCQPRAAGRQQPGRP